MKVQGLRKGDGYEEAWRVVVEGDWILRRKLGWEGLKEGVELIE